MPEVIADVALRQGAKNGGSCPQSYRSGRNGHAIRIFRAAGIGLQAAKIAQRRQHMLGQTAEEVLNSMQHRRGVRFHRHMVLRT